MKYDSSINPDPVQFYVDIPNTKHVDKLDGKNTSVENDSITYFEFTI